MRTWVLLVAFLFAVGCKGTENSESSSSKTGSSVPGESSSAQIPNGWKTLEGEGYRVAYPSDWELVQDGQNGTTFILMMTRNLSFRENINLIVGDPSTSSIEELAKMEVAQLQTVGAKIKARVISHRVVHSGKVPYFELKWAGEIGQPLQFKYRAYIWQGQRYGFTYTALPGTFEKYEAAAEKMLNTVEFR